MTGHVQMHSGGAMVRLLQPGKQVALRADPTGILHVAFFET